MSPLPHTHTHTHTHTQTHTHTHQRTEITSAYNICIINNVSFRAFATSLLLDS